MESCWAGFQRRSPVVHTPVFVAVGVFILVTLASFRLEIQVFGHPYCRTYLDRPVSLPVALVGKRTGGLRVRAEPRQNRRRYCHNPNNSAHRFLLKNSAIAPVINILYIDSTMMNKNNILTNKIYRYFFLITL
jgi:hypothetical protein